MWSRRLWTHPYANTDNIADSNTNSHPDRSPERDSHRHPNRDCYSDPHANANLNTGGNRYSVAYANPDADSTPRAVTVID